MKISASLLALAAAAVMAAQANAQISYGITAGPNLTSLGMLNARRLHTLALHYAYIF